MKTVVVYTRADGPPSHMRPAAAKADLVVLKHPDATWTVWKDRDGPIDFLARHVAWDDLPRRIKDAIPLYPAGT